MQLVSHKDGPQVLRDVVVPPKFYNRIDIGSPVLNELFGGQEMPGILPGCSFLFTGDAGAGKSTLALQLAELLTKHAGRNVLYNHLEESRPMIKMRSDRLGLNAGFCVNQIDDVDELLEFVEKHGVEVLFVDSVQQLQFRSVDGNARLKAIAKRFQSWKEQTDVTVFLIGHVTKAGKFAGPQEMKHDLDAHAHLRLDKDTGNRVLELEKNRHGPSAIPYEFSISANGLDFQKAPVATDAPAATGKVADRRDRVVALIKEKLLAGERISAYDQDRFEADCTGGFWRGMRERARKELEAEGISVGEMTVNGRGCYFVDLRNNA